MPSPLKTEFQIHDIMTMNGHQSQINGRGLSSYRDKLSFKIYGSSIKFIIPNTMIRMAQMGLS